MSLRTTLEIGLALLLVTSLGAGLAWAGDRTDTPGSGHEEPPGNPPPVPPDDGTGRSACNLVHSVGACLGGAAPTDVPVGEYMGLLTQALFDLQQRLGLEHIGSLRMAALGRTTWPSSCLGAALPPNIVCDQAIVPGFRMVLEADGALHTYHTSSDRVVYVGPGEVQGTSGVTPLPPNPVSPPPENGIAVCEPYPLHDGSGPGEPLPCDTGVDGCTVPYPAPDLDATDRLQGADSHQGIAIAPDGDVVIVEAGSVTPGGDGPGGVVVHPAPPPDAEQPPDIEPCSGSAGSPPAPLLEPDDA